MITYKDLYPKWLFPGKSEPDPSLYVEMPSQPDRCISFLNPFSFLRLGHVLNRTRRPTILTWWTVAWLPHSWLLMSQIKDKSRLVLWCHNVVDHDCGPIKAWLIRHTLSCATQFVVHTETDAERLRTWVPDACISVANLPLLPMPHQNQRPQHQTSDPPRLLFFGFVRPYKGLEDLLRAFPDVISSRKATLTIAGEFWGTMRRETESLISELKLNDIVTINDGYIPNEKLEDIFACHDLVVMPYRSATGSAVANMAIEFERPIVATSVGSLPDCINEGVNGYLCKPSNPADLSATIIKALDHVFSPDDLSQVRQKRKEDWYCLISTICNLLS